MTPAQDAAPEPADAEEVSAASDAAEAAPDAGDAAPQDDLKAKYREALAHKQASHGAASGGHGDRGATPHGTNAGPGQRMFRRKSG